MRIDFGQGEQEVIVSVATLALYEQEFNGADMIQDLYKKVCIRKSDSDDDIIAAIDFRNVNWTALTKVLWAALKTADDDTLPYKEWSVKVGDINLMDLNAQLGPEVERRLFRAGAAATEQK